MNSLRSDIEVLEAIAGGKTGIKTFDFEGQKYKAKKAGNIKVKLEKELEGLEKEIVELDKALFRRMYATATEAGKSPELLAKYRDMFKIKTAYGKDKQGYEVMLRALNPIYQPNIPLEEAKYLVKHLKSKEVGFRKRLKEMLVSGRYDVYLTAEQKKMAREYLAKNRLYLLPDRFSDKALEHLQNGLAVFWEVINDRYFKVRKELVEYQVQFLPEEMKKEDGIFASD